LIFLHSLFDFTKAPPNFHGTVSTPVNLEQQFYNTANNTPTQLVLARIIVQNLSCQQITHQNTTRSHQHITRQLIVLEENLQVTAFPFAISTRERSSRGRNLRFEGLERVRFRGFLALD
jgi:hypothetical protein